METDLTGFELSKSSLTLACFAVAGLVVVHNAGLCIASLIMCLGVLWETYKVLSTYYSEDPLSGAFCDKDKRFFGSSGVPYWSYLYYLSKYWEVRPVATRFA